MKRSEYDRLKERLELLYEDAEEQREYHGDTRRETRNEIHDIEAALEGVEIEESEPTVNEMLLAQRPELIKAELRNIIRVLSAIQAWGNLDEKMREIVKNQAQRTEMLIDLI